VGEESEAFFPFSSPPVKVGEESEAFFPFSSPPVKVGEESEGEGEFDLQLCPIACSRTLKT